MDEITKKDLEGFDNKKEESKTDDSKVKNSDISISDSSKKEEQNYSEIIKGIRDDFQKQLDKKDESIKELRKEINDLILDRKSNTAAPKSLDEIVVDKINSKRNFKKW